MILSQSIGNILDEHLGVPVYENGFMFQKSHGKSFAADGYYYGQKWQCIEYVKRFYREALKHEMPNVWGHARNFFDNELGDSGFNEERGLLQFRNGSEHPPQINDILVFQDTQYGHVGIVTRVEYHSVEIIQQNIFGQPRQRFTVTCVDEKHYIQAPRLAAGWLRKADETV
jgi:surface antigen